MASIKFKEGDIVKYVSGAWGDTPENPLWGGKYGKIKGRVCGIDSNWILVEWDNVITNSYGSMDLCILETGLSMTVKLDDELFRME